MEWLVKHTNPDIATHIVKEFIHTASLEECVRDYGAVPEFVLSHPDFNTIDIDTHFIYACRYGHLTLVLILIERGAFYWCWGFYEALENGHLCIADIVYQKLGNEPMLDKETYNSILGQGLWFACRGGNHPCVEFMLERVLVDRRMYLEGGMDVAQEFGLVDIELHVKEALEDIAPRIKKIKH